MTDMEAFTKLIQDKKKIGCYTKIDFDFGKATNIMFVNIPSGSLSNEHGTTRVENMSAGYNIKDFTHFYPGTCINTFVAHVRIKLLVNATWSGEQLMKINYSSDNYRKYISDLVMDDGMRTFIKERKETGCYSKVKFKFDESMRNMQFIRTSNKGVLSNEQGTSVVVLEHAQYTSTEDFAYFYPNSCADTFVENIPIKLSIVGDGWINSNLTIHYNSDNYRKYIDNSYDNTYHWIMFGVGNLLMSLSLSNLYLMYGNKGGYSAAKAANTESAKVLQATQAAQAVAATLKEIVLANTVASDGIDTAIKDKTHGGVDIDAVSSAAFSAIESTDQLKVNTREEIINKIIPTYKEIVNKAATDILVKKERTILTTAKELIAANIITPENIDTIHKAIAGATDIAQTAFITANEIKALTQGAQGRIEAAVGQAGRTYSSPHIAAKRSIFIISTLVASASAIFVTHSAVNLISSDSFERKEEQVIYNSKLGSSSSDRAVMTKVGGTTSALVGTALMLVPASHKNNGGFTYDLHTRSKCLSFVLGATLFAGGIFWASSSDVSDVKEQKPIGIELEPGRAMDLISLRESTTYFSYSDDGALSRTSWVGPNDAILFYDFNGTGQADHWSKFVMTEWSEQDAVSDFDALLEVFDTNHDMLFDTKDDHYSNFYIWQDANSNGAVEAGELTQLTEAGIVAIDFNTAAAATPAPTSADTAVVEWADGHTTLAHDLTFQYEAESTSIAIA